MTLRADGDYDFVGRRDSQIKSRGYRIELGEIEAALLSHPAVKEAAAVAVPDNEVGIALRPSSRLTVAPLSPSANCNNIARSGVPQYMIPELIEFRETLPKTSTGKLDRVQLAAGR